MAQCPNSNFSFFLLFIGLFHFLNPIFGQNERQKVFRVPESLAPGQHIGFVRGENGEPLEAQKRQNFFIVFPPEGNGTAERILRVNEKTGEIAVREGQSLDREAAAKMHILAIPVDGNDPIEIKIEILDENDNAPAFPVDSIRVEISEYARINTEMSLPKAKDPDEGKFGIQRYRIASGNVNNAFRLSFDGDAFLDLVVNGQLDREYRAKYELVVEAVDGGRPPKVGSMRVQVDVLDANDNAPEFVQPHYSARIGPNVGPGIPILRVAARDPDEGENGRINYSIALQSLLGPHSSLAPSIWMQIDPQSGAISLQNPLPPNLTGPIIFELVISARDQGVPNPLEAATTVQIVIEGRGKGEAEKGMHRLGLIWLTEDGTPENVPEGLPLGQVLARVSIEGEMESSGEMKLSLIGGQSAICLRQTDSSSIYLLVVCGEMDREKMAVLQMDLLLRRGIGGDVLLDHPIHLGLKDLNDNAPRWNSTNFRFEWNLGEEGAEGRRLEAKDEDAGENGRIEYKLRGTELFGIDGETGELWLRKEKQIPFCLSDSGEIHFQVEAQDRGNPPLSAQTNVSILLRPVHSTDSSRIRFALPLFESAISEDIPPGSCFFQISAFDNAFCPGQNSTNLHFWLSEGKFSELFKLDPKNGVLCTKEWMDVERDGALIQLEAMAGNGDGDEASAQMLIRLEDVNDNSPYFLPREYSLLLSPDGLDPSKALLRVRAIDGDLSAKFNQINFEMGEGIGAELFKIGKQNGELRLTELGAKKLGMAEAEGQIGMYGMELRVEARDSGGRRSEEMASIRVRLLPAHFHCMSFSERIYHFKISEETLPGIGVGDLRVQEMADPEKVRFEILEGNGLFGFDEMRPNRLVLEGELDADKAGGEAYLLNIKAIDGIKNCTNFTQIFVEILDANDNGPKFGAQNVSVELAEDQPIHVPFYAVKAMDKDRGEENGRISYELVGIRPNNSLPILVHPQTGALSLSAQLDADSANGDGHYWIRVRALDHGIPPKSAEMELALNVLDVNDNAPKFEQPEYSIEAMENAEIGKMLTRVEAKDGDKSWQNRRIHYEIGQLRPAVKNEEESILGINSRSGQIFLRHQLDREKFEEYSFELRATDGGNPPRNGTAQMRLWVLDVNDNAPNCSKTILELRAGQRAGEVVGRVEARDADKGPNGSVRMRMQQPGNALFQLGANGDVLLREDVNESILARMTEEGAMNSFLVIAEDQPVDSGPMASICQVTVQIAGEMAKNGGIELIGPKEGEIIWLDKKMKIGAEVVRVNARGVAKWALEGGEEYFVMEEGIVRLGRRVEEGMDARVTIRMEPSIGGMPKLISFRMRTREEEKGGEKVEMPANWTIEAKMPIFQMGSNGSGRQFYRLEGADEEAEKIVDGGMFELDELTGALFVADWPPSKGPRTLISLRISTHSLVDDDLGEENERRIRVEMGEWMERGRMETKMGPKCAKIFEKWKISEKTPIGNLVGKVEVEGEKGHFWMENGGMEENGGMFRIDGESGEIFTKGRMDWKKERRHILEVKIGRIGTKMGTKCIRQVDIERGEMRPKLISRPNATVIVANLERGMYKGGILHYFVMETGKNEESSIEFQIEGPNELGFQIGPKGSLSLPAPSFIPPNISSLQLAIRASISPSIFAEQNFTIFFDHFGRRQFAYFDRSQFWAELQMQGGGGGQKQFVANFRRKDGPENVEFLLLPPFAGFSFDNSANLFYSPPPNADQQIHQNLTLIVIARPPNSSLHFDHSQLNISPIFPKKGPKIEPTSCGNLSIPEGMKIDDLLRIRLAEGESETVIFGIEGGNWHSLFSIHPKSGWLSCAELDREAKAEHLLMISATDLATSPRRADVCSVRIEVMDRNDNAPRLGGEIGEKLELGMGAKEGQVLGRIGAEDGDEGPNGEVEYVLESDQSGMFDVDLETGEFTFERETAFLYEQSGVWVGVKAMDRGVPAKSSEEKRIRIEWGKRERRGKRLNLEFSRRKYSAQIWEGMPRGQMVAKLELVNREEAGEGPLSLSIVSGNLDSAFQIDHFARLWTNLELDAEIRPEYSLQILAFSGNGQRAECGVRIRVLDKEDNAPAIRRPFGPIKLMENIAVGTQIAWIGANDVDSTSKWMEYSIWPEEHFQIGRWTGRVHLAKELDFEGQRRHQLGIQASDGINRSLANLTVEVLDANDNAPKFENHFLELELAKNAQIGELLAKLEANDGDGTERNGRVKFELVEGETGDWAELDGNTGELRLRKAAAGIGRRFLTVKAVDSGRPPLASFCSVHLGPLQSVDFPSFSSPSFTFSIPPHFPPNLPIGQLRLSAARPFPPNCDFSLHFPSNSSASISSLFRVDFDGTIFLNGILDGRMPGKWVDLEASVSRCPPLPIEGPKRATTSVRIQILEENENWPEFEEANWPAKILIGKNVEKGKLLAKVKAMDEDSKEGKSKILYSILAGDEFGMLEMEEEKGELRMGERGEEWGRRMGKKMEKLELVICARDSGIPPRRTVKTMEIGLEENWTMELAAFGVPIYRKFVPENTPPGTILFRAKIANENGEKWKYSVEMDKGEWNETISMDPSTGRIVLTAPLDLEGSANSSISISFKVIARNEEKGLEAKVPAQIFLLGVDEFAPEFSKNAFTFQLPQNPRIGHQFGQVLATDKDIGIGSRIRYSLDPADLIAANFVRMDPSNGTLSILRMPSKNGGNQSEATVLRFAVWAHSPAKSFPPKKAIANVFLEIGPSPLSPDYIPPSPSPPHHFIPLLLLPFLLLLLCCLCALFLAKLFLRAQRLPRKSPPDSDFLRPTPKKRVFTVSACRQVQLEQQRQLASGGILCRGLSPSFESGQFSQNNQSISAPKSANYMNIPPPQNNPPMPSGGSRRSQPDSGIDPDRISTGSEGSGIGLADEFLRKLGVEEKKEGNGVGGNGPEDEFLDELIYAPLEEIFGPEGGEGEMWRRRKEMQTERGLGQPILGGGKKTPEMIIPFKTLGEVMGRMEAKRGEQTEGKGSSRV